MEIRCFDWAEFKFPYTGLYSIKIRREIFAFLVGIPSTANK